MDQAQRKKDQFYRVKAQADRLKEEVGKWRAVVDLAETELESAAASIVALKADVERMKAEHQAEVDGLHATLIELRDKLTSEEARLNWLMDSSHWVQYWPFGPEQEKWSSPGGDEGELFAATSREAIDRAIGAQS